MTLIVTGLLTFVCLAWMAASLTAVRMRRAVPLLDELAPPEPFAWPRLSIVVAARDEVETLRLAARSWLAQDYPDLQIVLVDDRSEDGTSFLVDELAAEDERVVALHVHELPEGWLGKNHGLHLGRQAATGEWLLFTDADVHLLRADALRRAVAVALHREVDHLVALPDIESNSFLLDIALAAFGRSFTLGQRLWAVADPESDASVGVGAFNMVRAAALDATQGFPWLRLDVADDLALGMLLKRSGAHCALVGGTGFVSVEWYPGVRAMAVGLEKNLFAVMGCSFGRVLGVSLLALAVEAAPYLAIARGGFSALMGGLALASAIIASTFMCRWFRRPLLPALMLPVGTLLFVGMLLRAGILGARRGGIRWRGTFYPSALLRSGARVQFP